MRSVRLADPTADKAINPGLRPGSPLTKNPGQSAGNIIMSGDFRRVSPDRWAVSR